MYYINITIVINTKLLRLLLKIQSNRRGDAVEQRDLSARLGWSALLPRTIFLHNQQVCKQTLDGV